MSFYSNNCDYFQVITVWLALSWPSTRSTTRPMALKTIFSPPQTLSSSGLTAREGEESVGCLLAWCRHETQTACNLPNSYDVYCIFCPPRTRHLSGAVSLKRAYEHATTSFSNSGAQVVVGPASSGPSMMASYALQTFTDADGYGIPQMR